MTIYFWAPLFCYTGYFGNP